MTEDTRDYEAEARKQGWKPLSEFDKPENQWTDPKTFVEKGDKIAGILKSRLDRQDREIAGLRESNKEFGQYQQTLREKDRTQNTTLLAELEVLRATAINDQDGAEFSRLDRQMNDIRNDMRDPEPTRPNGPPEMDPMATAWISENQWYNDNPTLRTYADGLVGQINSEGYSGQAYYNEITRRVKDTFPKEFGNPNRSKSNSVETGGEIDVDNPAAKTYANLDAESKAACDRFVANGLTTKEDYVANFDW